MGDALLSGIRAGWLAQLLSSEPCGRPQAEAALRDLYASAGLPGPDYFFWLDSPFLSVYAMILLSAPQDLIAQRTVQALERIKNERHLFDKVRGDLCRAAALTAWEALLRVTGEPLTLAAPFGRAPAKTTVALHSAVSLSRLKLFDDVRDAVSHFNEKDVLQRAEQHLRAVMSGQSQWGSVNPWLNTSFYNHYTFSMMAFDETAAREREVPPALSAAWRIARSAGPWWPFTHSVVISERPTELHVNAESLLHHGGGPAAVFRDGTRVWAWRGRAMREEWILNPETISSRDLKHFEPDFREYAAARTPALKPKGTPKLSSILKKPLPLAAEEQVSTLRRHNHGELPFFDRYRAGEHEKVWEELIALGPSVREDPRAADALAVAYETMRRVEANVRTITARLQSLEYRFVDQPHEPPGGTAGRQIARIEKRAGALPFSLRAFYETVGAVNWMGEHARLAPRNDSVAPDPLVVFSVDDVLAQFDSGWFEESDEPAIFIAPDDLHKANTSGGSPYAIAVPDLHADGKLLNEGHDLYFVAYLRLAFRFGGFPGYDGVDPLPPELATLWRGLVPF